MFSSVKAPPNKGGRPRSITLVMLEALCEHLLEKPTLYLDEMVVFCGTNSLSSRRNRASVVPLGARAGQKRLPTSRPESAT
jgi:hypothetical protein